VPGVVAREETTVSKHSKIATLSFTALMIIGLVGPAAAGARPRLDITGTGTYGLDDGGSAQLAGAVTGTPFDGDYTATLSTVDASLPGPGACEGETARVTVAGTVSRQSRLEASGEVCGKSVQPPIVEPAASPADTRSWTPPERKLRGAPTAGSG
jgi:hypothetical protein